MKKWPFHFSHSIRASDLLHFFRQLSTLLSAGLSLIKCFDILIQTQDKISFRRLIQTLRIDLESGNELHRCLQRHPQLFDLFSCQLIRIGERTGTLEETLQRIMQYKEKSQALKIQLQQALIYPSVILATAVLTILFLLLWLVPQFATLFEHFPNKLPPSTQILIHFSFGLQKLLPALAWLSLVVFLTLFHFRNAFALRKKSLKLFFKLPGCRSLLQQITLATLARSLASTLSAGLPLTEALLLVAQLSPLATDKTAIYKLHAGVTSGKTLSSTLKDSSFFPALLVHMVQIGEESGTLDRMFEKFAEISQTELERKLNLLRTILEPLIITILGVLIGGIIIILYLPIFRLGTAI